MLRAPAAVLVPIAMTLAAAALSVPAAGAARQDRALNRAVRLVRAAGAPGVLVLTRHGGRTKLRAFGVADPRTHRPLRPDTPFRIGSITKSFVATVVLQLAGEGKLGLDDPITRWFPHLVPQGRRITIRELLAHRSGLYDYLADPRVLRPYAKRPGYVWTTRRLIGVATSHTPLFVPGSSYGYSNTNYVLLGLVVAKVTGRSLGAVLQRRIFEPLRLTATRYAPNAHVPATIAHGLYRGQRPPLDTTFYNASYADAAGAIVSTTTDLAVFYRALLGGRLLKRAQLKAMEAVRPIAPNGSAYGLGLLRVPTPCGDFFGHNGDIAGYSTFALARRDGSRVAVVAATADGWGPGGDQAFNELVAVAACH